MGWTVFYVVFIRTVLLLNYAEIKINLKNTKDSYFELLVYYY